MDVSGSWIEMVRAVRNIGRPGVASEAISAVDTALWDLKAKLLDLPLVSLLGRVRNSIAIYGSGGFTSYTIEQLQEQMMDWVGQGIGRIKMKVGRHPDGDAARVGTVREVVGPAVDLYVDASGAYSRKQALAMADMFSYYGVSWFEEPVPSDDLEGLHLIRIGLRRDGDSGRRVRI